jgi:hypothetical protein
MTPDDVRTLDLDAPKQATRLQIVDCDVHPAMRSVADVKPFLAQRCRGWIPGRRAAGHPAPTSISCARSCSTPTTSAAASCIRCSRAGWTSATRSSAPHSAVP